MTFANVFYFSLLYSGVLRCLASNFTSFIKDDNVNNWQCTGSDIVFEQTGVNRLSCIELCSRSDSCTAMFHTASMSTCKGCRTTTSAAVINPQGNTGVTLYRKTPKECDAGWFQFQDMCYWTGEELMIFDKAWQTCEQMGSRVVHIDTAEENTFLVNKHMDRYYSSVYQLKCSYIGVSDEIDEGIWRYYDTKEIAPFLGFQYPEPNNAHIGGEQCAAFLEHRYYWVDYRCSELCLPQCEKRL